MNQKNNTQDLKYVLHFLEFLIRSLGKIRTLRLIMNLYFI